jgi:hypothetical protein
MGQELYVQGTSSSDVTINVTPNAIQVAFTTVSGAPGGQGSQGIPGNDGRSLDPRGVYSSSTTYDTLDIVDDGDGSSFVSLQDTNLNHALPTDGNSTTWWGVMSLEGDVGPQGPIGAQGGSGTSNLIYRGIWASGVHYNIDDIVTWQTINGSSSSKDGWYRNSTDHTDASGENPLIDPNSYWTLILTAPVGPRGLKGASGGTGDTGPTGPAGAASTVPGPTGPTGSHGTNGTNGANGLSGLSTFAQVPGTTYWAVPSACNVVSELIRYGDGTDASGESSNITIKVQGTTQTIPFPVAAGDVVSITFSSVPSGKTTVVAFAINPV